MGGKTIASSTSSDALKNSSISKTLILLLLLLPSNEPMVDRDRFRLLKLIIGGEFLLIKEFGRSSVNAASSAAVAGERAAKLVRVIEAFMMMMMMQMIIRVKK